ncbi:hypothetical protein ACIQI8_42180 [Streptomyces sp. NPDC092369]|uniref:hypothetical protein n=1 Tax=Streptomyces sp. NPDC092369 TaxID=3366015 RepID=UPI00381E7195
MAMGTEALVEAFVVVDVPALPERIDPRGYTSGDVHRWLHHLTTHLDPTDTLHTTTPASAESTDLVLHEL